MHTSADPQADKALTSIPNAAPTHGKIVTRVRRKLFPYVLVGGFSMLLLGSSFLQKPPATAKLLTIAHGTFSSELHELGTVEAHRILPILGRVNGEIVWKTEEGTFVAPGEPIVKFDSKLIEDDLEVRERDLIEKQEAVRRAQTELNYIKEKYIHVVHQAEVELQLAELERSHALGMPTSDDKLDADLTLQSTGLDMQKSKLDYESYQLLLKQGYVSDAAVKKQLLDLVTKKADNAKAKLIYDLTLAGATSETRRVVELAVADARKRLHIAQFNREADINVNQSALDLAKIDLANFERDLQRKRQELEWCTVRAPMHGNVVYHDVFKGSSKIKSPIQVGETRTAGNELCMLCDTSLIRVKLLINEADVKNVSVGQQATVRLPAIQGRVFKATVSNIGVVAEDKNTALSSLALRKAGEAFVNVVIVRLEFTDLGESDRRIMRVGFTADVTLQTSTKNEGLVVPWSAVGYDPDGTPFVDVMRDSPERRRLKLGRSDNEGAEVLEGLAENEKVLARY